VVSQVREIAVNTSGKSVHYIDDPLAIKLLFSSLRLAWLWGILRVWVGYQWIEASLHKVGNPAWVQSGTALQKFWEKAVVVPRHGDPRVPFDWYREFLGWLLGTHAAPLMARLIAYGELAVGVALILGLMVGAAAFAGTFMNWNYLMAGSVSLNPLMIIGEILLIMSWKVAGYYGLDRYLLLRSLRPAPA
jgi:thiosulfate dehydrogenase (quinone) large subunit